MGSWLRRRTNTSAMTLSASALSPIQQQRKSVNFPQSNRRHCHPNPDLLLLLQAANPIIQSDWKNMLCACSDHIIVIREKKNLILTWKRKYPRTSHQLNLHVIAWWEQQKIRKMLLFKDFKYSTSTSSRNSSSNAALYLKSYSQLYVQLSVVKK